MNLHYCLSVPYFIIVLFLLAFPQYLNSSVPFPVEATTVQDISVIEPGQRVTRELKGNQKHVYKIAVPANAFLHLVIGQHGIDVVVSLYGPDGKRVAEVDSPNGTEGPESLLLITETPGSYLLEIRSLEEKAVPGRYEARIEALRVATEQDRKHVKEIRQLKEAEELTDRVLELNKQGKYEEAIPLAERVVTIREATLGPEHIDVAAALNNLAEMYKNHGDYSRAAELHERALKIKQAVLGADHIRTATSFLNLAEVYRESGMFDRAEALYKRAIAIYEKKFGETDPTLAQALNNLALLYDLMGNYSTSESLYLRALAIREKALGARHPDTGITLSNLTDLYREMGDPLKAEDFGTRALSIFEQAMGKEHPYVATALNNLGLVYVAKGDFQRAETLYQRSLSIREKILRPEHPDIAGALVNLAALYSRVGKPGSAVKLYERILSIDEKAFGKEHPNTAADLSNLAYLLDSQGDRVRAERFYQRALSVTEKALGPTHPQVATILTNLSLLYYRSGDVTKAKPLAERALTIRDQSLGKLHSDVATSLSNLAALYEAQDDVTRAIQARARGNDIRERALSRILAVGSEKDKLSYLSTFVDEVDLTVSLHNHSAPNDPEAIRLALTTVLQRKGRVLDAMSEQFALLRNNLDSETQALFDELATMNRQLAGLIMRGAKTEGLAEFSARVSNLENEAERLRGIIGNRSVRFRLQSQPLTIEAVQRAIPTGAALIELVNYTAYDARSAVFTKRRYCAYVLREEGPALWVDLGEAATIDRHVSKLRLLLSNRTNLNLKVAARELDNLVFRPIRKVLGNADHVFISPDGALNLIPFASLVDERGRYVLESYSITYLTSGRDLLRLQRGPENRQPPVVIADPLFDYQRPRTIRTASNAAHDSGRRRSRDLSLHFNPLPGTADEAKALATVLSNAEVLTGAKATESALRRVHAPSILHVATHGFFLPKELPTAARPNRVALGLTGLAPSITVENPLLRSGLALAGANQPPGESDDDGILTALEATALDLWGTKLVVLSACETGLGEVKTGEGVYGLRRALVIAGSEAQLMSLWKVSDLGTRDLMTAYYIRLQTGEGRAEALRQVQLMMLRGQLKPIRGSRKRGTIDTGESKSTINYRHPYYWAAFIQSGDWRNMIAR